ncbi:MAG: DNA recombination protein RmuC, partial [Tepidisphaeraceae bacterium]
MEAVWILLGLLLGGGGAAVIATLVVERRSKAALAAAQTELAVANERAAEAQRRLVEAAKDAETHRQHLSALQQERAALLAQLNAEKENVAQQRDLLTEARSRLRESFAEVSGEALRNNSKHFFEVAEQTFKTLQTEASGALDERKAQIDQMLQPMKAVLEQYKQKLDSIEKSRVDAYVTIKENLAAVAATQQNLSLETKQLVTALRRPQGRGRWGELTLRRLFELAGMSERVTFDEQVNVNTESGRLRPDCIVHLPENRQVIVDSKCVIDAFLDASACTDDGQRLAFLVRHAQQVRSRVAELSSKAYWDSFERATDYVVLFLPGEAFLYAAVEQDPGLIEDALNQRVIVASPTTLLGLLRVIEHGWRHKAIEQNAQEIRKLGATLYDRIQTAA